MEKQTLEKLEAAFEAVEKDLSGRVAELAVKSTAGTLSQDEQAEYEHIVRLNLSFRQARLTFHFESAISGFSTQPIRLLSGGDHYDVSTAQPSQKPSRPLPEPTTSEGVA